MMTDFFLSFLEISIAAGLVIVPLVLLTPLFHKRYAAKWKYWIWIFLALRLLLPFNPADGMSAVRTLAQRAVHAATRPEKAYEDNSPDLSDLPIQAALPGWIILALPEQMTAPIGTQTENNSGSLTILDLAAYVWIFGALIFLFVHVFSYLYFKRQVTKRGMAVKDIGILRQTTELKHELHISRRVRVIQYPKAASPLMMGFLTPVLVLPDEKYGPEELFFILKHELVHLKRGDVYMKLLFVTANALHWFNPLVWLMQREAEVDMELSCDERVTQGADYATRKAYTETLLSTLRNRCEKRKLLSTQFYGGKKIMRKRFQNILIKTRKRNGAVIFLLAAVLTVALGALVGCSVGKENPEENGGDIPKQTEDQTENQKENQTENNNRPGETGEGETESEAAVGSGTDEELSAETAPEAEKAALEGEPAAESTRVLTMMKEGESEEKRAILVTDDIMYHEFSFYLPDGEWQKEETAMWQAVANEDVHLWVSFFEKDYPIAQLLADDGYVPEDDVLARQEGELAYKARLYEDGDYVWCIEYSYPVEAEEGWGRELPVIADTFAVTAPTDIIDGYITAFDNGVVTIDRQVWATVGSKYWKPEYNEDAGFEVVDEEGEDITYPLHEECSFFILENHNDPSIELNADEFADYLKEMEYPVLWIFELEDGQIKSITEQYIP